MSCVFWLHSWKVRQAWAPPSKFAREGQSNNLFTTEWKRELTDQVETQPAGQDLNFRIFSLGRPAQTRPVGNFEFMQDASLLRSNGRREDTTTRQNKNLSLQLQRITNFGNFITFWCGTRAWSLLEDHTWCHSYSSEPAITLRMCVHAGAVLRNCDLRWIRVLIGWGASHQVCQK